MRSSTYWKAVLQDGNNFLERVLEFLKVSGTRFCVIGGTGVNAYAYPVVTEDLDIVVAEEEIEALEASLSRDFKVRRFAHRVNVSAPPSKLQIQIQTDPRYFDFINRCQIRNVMDFEWRISKTSCKARFGRPWMRTAVKASGRRISPILPASSRLFPSFVTGFRRNSCRRCFSVLRSLETRRGTLSTLRRACRSFPTGLLPCVRAERS